MADAMEALRKDVHKEAADELAGVERHGGVAAGTLDAVVLDLERDACGVCLDEAAVRDGDAVGVAGQIGEHGLGTREWALGIDEPALLPEWGQEGSESLCFYKMRVGTEELEP